MPLFGKIIVIKRNGTDGIHFPLTASSCLFGRLNCLQDLNSFIQLRRTECDIRIQLPQVSKEHCKIEVNENEEAILTNLSTVNPTQLNGSCFQQPVPLKHGDVLTIIDRSFRFEYPLQSTPRRRRSRSPKDESRQQVAEVELLRKQTSGPKRSADHSECEEQNADENKQSTEKNMCKALPVKLQTPTSSYKIKQSIKKENEMSPFSKLYETLKYEIKVKKPLQEGNVPGKEAGKGALQEPSAQIASSCDPVSLTKEKEIGISENNEECKMKQDVIGSEFNQISTVGSATKKCFTRSPRTSLSKEMRKGRRSNLQDHKEVSTPGKSKGTEVTAKTPKPSKENDRNAACLLEPCSIERLGEVKIYSSAIRAEKIAQKTKMTNVSEVDKHVSTPTPRRKSPRSCFMSPTKEATGMDSVNIGTPTTRGGALLEHNSLSEISAEIQREDSVCRNDSLQQLPLGENKCLKQRRNSKQHTPRKSAKVEVLKEICDQANVNTKKRDSESPVSDSKSPRRNVRQSKEFVNKSILSETPISGEVTSKLASPASQKSGSGRKRGRPRSSELQTEKALETNAVQEHHNKTVDSQDSGTQQDLATNGCDQQSDLEDASVPRPQRLSSKRSSGSANVLEGNEAVSEMHVSDLLAEEESGNTKRVSQKRKSGDLLPQPLGKRKRVSFGGHLSPELFDKSLPPNSPLKRGAIPARLSLPFGDSPRAVLKKAQGLRHFAVQELSVQLEKEEMSPKKMPAQTPPAASSPDSGKATPQLTMSSPAPYTKGRFSVSHVTTPSPIAEEQSSVAKDMNTEEKNSGQVKTPTSDHVSQDDKTSMATPNKLTKSSQRSSKKTPLKRRSGAVAVINSKRRSGASTANLLVAKSWAEVVKLGVVRPQTKAVKKRTQKGRPVKKITQSPKTPGRKIKGHFSTGHAESPPTIVVGRAYSTTVRTAGQVPKVVKNPISKQNLNMDDSFIGLFDLFENPENRTGRRSPSSTVNDSDVTSTCATMETSELYASEESGEMVVSSSNIPDSSGEQLDCQAISYSLREKESPQSVFEITSTKNPGRGKAELEEDLDVDSVSIIAEKQESQVKLASKRKTPDQKLESVEVASGIEQLLRTPQKKPEPAEVLSGIKQLMKTPKQKPEPAEVGSENVMDPKQEGAGTPCANDSREYGGNKTVLEYKGNTSQGKDSQQKLSASEDHSTQRRTRGRPRKTAHPPSIKQCEKDLNLKELQRLEKKSIQEEMGEISSSTSVAKNTRRGRRTNPCVEKEIVSKHPDEKAVETVSLVETQADTQRPRRGKTKEPKELKHLSEDLESSEKDSSVLQKDPANRKQTLQEYDINDTSVTEDDQSRKTEGVSSSTQDENYQLQTDLKKSENPSDKGSVEDREETLLSHQERSRGMKNMGNTEALLPPKRGRRARNELVEQASSEELHGTRRKLRKDQSAKLLQGDERTSETAPTEESENSPKIEVKVTEKRGKSSRNARKHPAGVKADMCGVAPENTQNVQKAKETSSETVTETQSPTKNERKVSLGDEAENAQEKTTRSSQRLTSESPSGETDTMPITVLNSEANRSSVRGANRTRNRRGKKDSSEKKGDEFAQDVNSLGLKPKYKSETEESSPKESSASSCVEQSHQVMKDQNNTAEVSVTALNGDSVAYRRQKRTRNEQEANEPKQTEILQENHTQNNGSTHQRVRGRKVHFKFEASSEALGEERNLPGNEEGMACKNDQHEASEKPLQVRRSRRRQVDSIPQAACSTFMEKETLIKDHSKDETFVKDQDPALEAIPSSTEEVPLRGRRRREVAVASQTVSSLPLRKKRGLLEGDDKKMTVKEDQNPALGNNTAEAKSSASLRRKRGLSETDKEESTNEEQNMLLESASCAKAKPLGRGRRKETPPVSHTTNCISLRRKRGLPADNGGEEAPKDQNVPLGTVVSGLKEDQQKRGRRNEAAVLLEATSSTPAQGKRSLSRESSRKNNHREAKKMTSEKPLSEEKMDLSKGNSGKKISITSLAVSSSSLQGLPQDGKNETPEEQQGILLEVTPSAQGNPSKAGRRKIVPSKSEETSAPSLREKLVLPEDRGQKGALKEGEGTALENNSSQEKHRQLRNKRRNVQLKSAAATSLRLNGNLPENGNISEAQCLKPTGSEENNQSGKGNEVNPTQQTTSRRRKCLLPADDLPPKKLKSEKNENRSPKKGKRNKTEEKLEGDAKTTQAAGGTNRTTRASTRASARMRK
ncbi:proliferation marker protein Ki-67 isoform X2 [Oxyura jamaicensis]|uniref:proliferation marker protein Ki-67 isoform X2 n=1 Tax=Oxyura jamaicensis TaxID=8884 RepID=UPI0015A515C5|nr:proliferation marker protein Ki-67 isoform X2 [Oxyura jamaicensis]